jgi:hypothetical protein
MTMLNDVNEATLEKNIIFFAPGQVNFGGGMTLPNEIQFGF